MCLLFNDLGDGETLSEETIMKTVPGRQPSNGFDGQTVDIIQANGFVFLNLDDETSKSLAVDWREKLEFYNNDEDLNAQLLLNVPASPEMPDLDAVGALLLDLQRKKF